jgi:prevent-host-death family protein
MKTYSFTDVSKTPGVVLEEALKSPVVLTKRGKEKLVVVPAQYFRRLTGRPHAEAYSIHELPDEIAKQLDEGLDAILGQPKDR